jgi:Zn-dependent protease with chaperone function
LSEHITCCSGSHELNDILMIMLGRILAISVTVAVVLLTVLLQTTTPATSGPLGILVIFVLMYVSAVGMLTFLLWFSNRLLARALTYASVKRPLQPLSLRKSYYFASVVALAPVMFIGMQSVGEVSFYELLLIVIFIAISCVYIAKRSS